MKVTYEDRPIFDQNCRNKGTRIDRIMTMLEHGYSDAAIAIKYNTTASTIAVYRKALNGTLCTLTPRFNFVSDPNHAVTRMWVMSLYDDGYTRHEIADRLHVNYTTVVNIIRRVVNARKAEGKANGR